MVRGVTYELGAGGRRDRLGAGVVAIGWGLVCYVLRSYAERSRKRGVASRSVDGLRRANDPPLLILVSLADGPKHGHALAKDIEGFAGVTLGPGALYGAITRLEERGLIEPLDSEDRRRPYRITASGSAALAGALADMRRITRVGLGRLGLDPA